VAAAKPQIAKTPQQTMQAANPRVMYMMINMTFMNKPDDIIKGSTLPR
jgi:hypothetical protein